jgi:biotin carboxyl carrier protein
MKIYKIKVNGKIYQVELESVEENNVAIETHKQPLKSKGKTIDSPMQGTIQKILVNPGQVVKKGDSLMILEAMKLENDITAEKNFTVENVLVQVGDNVDSGEPLLSVL